jgi:S-DNA-T family DNA segregation ATPase FtsK/SpoIIIE
MNYEFVPASQDPMYEPAKELVLKSNKASISYVQRNLRIGYNRAARLIERMEKEGLVSPMGRSGVREVKGGAT